MIRLAQDTIQQLIPTISKPTYKNETAPKRIVHLGLGAFVRAHEAEYLHDLMISDPSADQWRIIGASLRSHNVFHQLAPQDFLYTLVKKESHGQEASLIRIIEDLIVAPDNPKQLIDVMVDGSVKIVSLTITEKGYYFDPATEGLMFYHPDIMHDIHNLSTPRTALGFIVASLNHRMLCGHSPFTVLSCDNLPANGDVTKKVVLDFASQVDDSLYEWIEEKCRFPNSMVDRIVPATTEEDREQFHQHYGVRDEALVVAEPFKQWVIEKSRFRERPSWENVGVMMVDDVTPFEKMKLRLLNGCHSTLAYLGCLAGIETISEVMQEPAYQQFMDYLMKEEITPSLAIPQEINIHEYQSSLIHRFKNRALKHRTSQIAMDGSQKLPQRLLETMAYQLSIGGNIHGLTLAVAAWIIYASGIDLKGNTIDVSDPMAETFRRIQQDSKGQPKDLVEKMLHISSIFDPSLLKYDDFTEQVYQWVVSLREKGVLPSVQLCQKRGKQYATAPC